MRSDGRSNQDLRPVTITRNFLKHPEGSCLIEMGETKVICTASVEENVPPHKKGSGQGWVTAEYAMLPRSTTTRMKREGLSGKGQKGRTHEIQRLIGRALRAVTDLTLLGERSVYIDADVIQADGGTRTASITGAFVALHDALSTLVASGKIKQHPIKEYLAAVSVGVFKGETLLDLNYEEDSKAEVDMNIVMTGSGKFVELQGTAEGEAFTAEQMMSMVNSAKKGINKLMAVQKDVLI